MEPTNSFDLETDADIFGFHDDIFAESDCQSDQAKTEQFLKPPRFDFIIEPIVGKLHTNEDHRPSFPKFLPEIFMENKYKINRKQGTLKTPFGKFKIIYKKPTFHKEYSKTALFYKNVQIPELVLNVTQSHWLQVVSYLIPQFLKHIAEQAILDHINRHFEKYFEKLAYKPLICPHPQRFRQEIEGRRFAAKFTPELLKHLNLLEKVLKRFGDQIFPNRTLETTKIFDYAVKVLNDFLMNSCAFSYGPVIFQRNCGLKTPFLTKNDPWSQFKCSNCKLRNIWAKCPACDESARFLLVSLQHPNYHQRNSSISSSVHMLDELVFNNEKVPSALAHKANKLIESVDFEKTEIFASLEFTVLVSKLSESGPELSTNVLQDLLLKLANIYHPKIITFVMPSYWDILRNIYTRYGHLVSLNGWDDKSGFLEVRHGSEPGRITYSEKKSGLDLLHGPNHIIFQNIRKGMMDVEKNQNFDAEAGAMYPWEGENDEFKIVYPDIESFEHYSHGPFHSIHCAQIIIHATISPQSLEIVPYLSDNFENFEDFSYPWSDDLTLRIYHEYYREMSESIGEVNKNLIIMKSNKWFLYELADTIWKNNPGSVILTIESEKLYNEDVCALCWAEHPEFGLKACGHVAYCQECGDQENAGLFEGLLTSCPLCRKEGFLIERLG